MILSLRARVSLAITGVAGTLAVILAGLLYAAVSALFWRDFDREVHELASIFAALVEWDGEVGYELEGEAGPAHTLMTGPGRFHVEVRTPAGVLLSDPALAGAGPGGFLDDPGDMPSGTAFELVASDGHRLRGVRLLTAARGEGDEPVPAGDVEIFVARETEAIEATLAAIARWCTLLAAATVLLAAAVAGVAAHNGMRPVRRLARAMGGIDGPDDALALTPAEVPRELRVIVREVNELLTRMREVFARERRFTADVSHELRTPLTVVRTSIDVALQGARDGDDLRRRLRGLQVDVERMASMLDSLLLLSRASAGQIALRRTTLPLYAIIEECWQPFAAAARARRLRFVNAVDPDAMVTADDTTLRMIVTNVLSNAAEYTETGGTIRATTDPDAGVLLAVHDSGPPIPEEQLARVLEPFWRADQARSDAGVHCGIGLSVAQALARCQALDVRLANKDGGVETRIEIRPAEAT